MASKGWSATLSVCEICYHVKSDSSFLQARPSKLQKAPLAPSTWLPPPSSSGWHIVYSGLQEGIKKKAQPTLIENK